VAHSSSTVAHTHSLAAHTRFALRGARPARYLSCRSRAVCPFAVRCAGCLPGVLQFLHFAPACPSDFVPRPGSSICARIPHIFDPQPQVLENSLPLLDEHAVPSAPQTYQARSIALSPQPSAREIPACVTTPADLFSSRSPHVLLKRARGAPRTGAAFVSHGLLLHKYPARSQRGGLPNSPLLRTYLPRKILRCSII